MKRKVVLSVGIVILVGLLGWAAADFVANDTIPGYVHRNGAGSRVDVRSDGANDGTEWTVVFTRNLQTGDPDHDIQLEPGGTYYFQVATWNNAGDELHDASEMNNVHSMMVPAAPGPLVFSGTPGIFEALTGEYLASGEVQITVRWLDASKDDRRKFWTFSGSDWTQSSENEDRLAFIWDLQGDQFASAGTCAAMCHTPRMYTAPDTFVDTWQWKATRTNPSGYADDKYWDDGNGGTASGRHSDPGQAPYKDNVADSVPSHMSEDDPGAKANFIFEFQEGMREAAAWMDGAWAAGDVLPGYVGRRGSGSRVDTRATATHDGSSWTVTIRRKLDTGDTTQDISFERDGTYYFQVATWNNAGDELHNTAEMNNVYSMMIPATDGPLMFSGTPSIFSSLTGELLDSDEIEITVVWPDATRNDLRKFWSFDGSDWIQSSENEDRVAFIWDMQEDQFASAGTCAAMCHTPNMYTAEGTFVDTWHWKATRTSATGFCDDKYWDDGAGGTGSGRHSDPGTSVYKDNADNGGAPSYMSAAGPGTSARFLFDHAPAAGWGRAVDFAVGALRCAGGNSYWTEIAAHLGGRHGSEWRTDLVLKNSSDSIAEVEFTLHTDSGEETMTGAVDPMAQGIIEDIVGTMGVEDKGALEICSTNPLKVISRIYNQAESGTFGQFIDGQTSDDGLSRGESAILLGLRQMEDEYRTNISVTNTGMDEADVRIVLYRTNGTELHRYRLSVAAGMVVQDLEPFKSRAGEPDIGWGYATVEVLSGSGILSSASVIDSITNDATTIPMEQ
jgi:hypothetical protein